VLLSPGSSPGSSPLRQGRTARENWVLDKRHVLYERVLEAVAPLNAAWSRDEAVDATLDPKFRAQLTNALLGLELLAPEDVRQLSRTTVYTLVQAQLGTTEALGSFNTAVRDLRESLREDLVPKHMR
jgi:hypothetical protein